MTDTMNTMSNAASENGQLSVQEAQEYDRQQGADIIHKLESLTNTVNAVANGDLDAEVDFESDDTIGKLGKGISDMIKALRKTKEQEDIQRRDLENKVDMLLKFSEQAGNGDLTAKVPFDGDDPMGQLARGLEVMLGNIREAMTNIIQGTEEINQGAQQISSASQSLSGAASEQAANLQQISASVEELSSMTTQNAESCTSAVSLSKECLGTAKRGEQEMQAMNVAVDDIMKSSNEISKIIKVIDEIAFQTNLLALNAAVEAARAGEAGKGFAVVAEEVRNLARRSAEAAKNTSSMIEESIKRAENGANIAKRVDEVLSDIGKGIEQINDLVDDIANASKEQAEGVIQINKGMSELDTVTQQNAGSSEELAATAEETAAQVATFRDITKQFKVDDSPSSHSSSTATTRSSEHAVASPTNHAKEVIPFDDDGEVFKSF